MAGGAVRLLRSHLKPIPHRSRPGNIQAFGQQWLHQFEAVETTLLWMLLNVSG